MRVGLYTQMNSPMQYTVALFDSVTITVADFILYMKCSDRQLVVSTNLTAIPGPTVHEHQHARTLCSRFIVADTQRTCPGFISSRFRPAVNNAEKRALVAAEPVTSKRNENR